MYDIIPYTIRETEQLSQAEIKRAKLRRADAELTEYTQGLKFGTPKFSAFADSTALLVAKAQINRSGAKINKLQILRKLDSEDVDYHNEVKKEYGESTAKIKETIRNHENTVPGYLDEEEAFNDLYDSLHLAEASRIELDSGIRQTGSFQELEKNPRLYTGAELSAEADIALCRKLEDIRRDVIKKAKKQI